MERFKKHEELLAIYTYTLTEVLKTFNKDINEDDVLNSFNNVWSKLKKGDTWNNIGKNVVDLILDEVGKTKTINMDDENKRKLYELTEQLLTDLEHEIKKEQSSEKPIDLIKFNLTYLNDGDDMVLGAGSSTHNYLKRCFNGLKNQESKDLIIEFLGEEVLLGLMKFSSIIPLIINSRDVSKKELIERLNSFENSVSTDDLLAQAYDILGDKSVKPVIRKMNVSTGEHDKLDDKEKVVFDEHGDLLIKNMKGKMN